FQVPEVANHRLQAGAAGVEVEAVVRGELMVAVGHQGALVGQGLLHQGQESGVVPLGGGKGVALHIEFDARMAGHQPRQVADIAGADMALVGAGVDGDAVNASGQADLGVPGQGRVVPLPGIADQGDFVEVDTELDHGAGSSRMERICGRSTGRFSNLPRVSTSSWAMASITAMPSMTLPNTV